MIGIIRFFSCIFFCCSSFLCTSQDGITVSVTNKTGFFVTDLVVFSQPLGSLPNEKTAKTESFAFKLQKHNPIIKFTIGDVNFARYLSTPDNPRRCYIYSIDSVNLDQNIFWISEKNRIKE